MSSSPKTQLDPSEEAAIFFFYMSTGLNNVISFERKKLKMGIKLYFCFWGTFICLGSTRGSVEEINVRFARTVYACMNWEKFLRSFELLFELNKYVSIQLTFPIPGVF